MKVFSMKFEEDELKSIKARAKQEKISISEFIRKCIRKELKKGFINNLSSHSFMNQSSCFNQEVSTDNCMSSDLASRLEILEQFTICLGRNLTNLNQLNSLSTSQIISGRNCLADSLDELNYQQQELPNQGAHSTSSNFESTDLENSDTTSEASSVKSANSNSAENGELNCVEASSKPTREKITEEQEKQLIDLALSPPPVAIKLPVQVERWTLRTLAEGVMRLGIINHISHEAVRAILKKHNIDIRNPSA